MSFGLLSNLSIKFLLYLFPLVNLHYDTAFVKNRRGRRGVASVAIETNESPMLCLRDGRGRTGCQKTLSITDLLRPSPSLPNSLHSFCREFYPLIKLECIGERENAEEGHHRVSRSGGSGEFNFARLFWKGRDDEFFGFTCF